jgi:tRNA A37 threonylcarbamoyladenosine modification protein TsaB
MVNAFKNQVYVSSFEIDKTNQFQRKIEVQSLELTELEKRINTPHLCLGDGYLVYEKYLPEGLKKNLIRSQDYVDSPQARILSQLATQDLGLRRQISWKELLPLYIRASEAEEKLNSSGD